MNYAHVTDKNNTVHVNFPGDSSEGPPRWETVVATDTNTTTRLEHNRMKHKDTDSPQSNSSRISIQYLKGKDLSPLWRVINIYSKLKKKQLKDSSLLILTLTILLSTANAMVTIEPRERPNIPTLCGITWGWSLTILNAVCAEGEEN